MNHDNAHCLDYKYDCPKECFRGQLVRDVLDNPQVMVVSWMSFEGTDECMKEKNHEQSRRNRD